MKSECVKENNQTFQKGQPVYRNKQKINVKKHLKAVWSCLLHAFFFLQWIAA